MFLRAVSDPLVTPFTTSWETSNMAVPRTISGLRRATAVGCAAVVAMSGVELSLAGATTAPATVGTTHVATHEWAAAQPTAVGRQILDLEVHDGKVWAGYGDYGANTGPITIASYDPTNPDGFAAATVVDTEAALNLRSLGDELVAPATDPRRAADFAIGAPWEQDRPVAATHVFDTATLTGEDLWLVGSKGNDAVAWRSLDDGATWDESLRVSPPGDIDGDFSRFYFAATMGGALYVQAVSHSRGAGASSMMFDGSTWSEAPSLLTNGGVGWKPQPFGDGVVYGNTGQGIAGGIYYFDGESVTTIGVGWDVEVAGGSVWILALDGQVTRSRDLVDWNTVVTGPSDSRSMAVDGEDLYLGTADSQLVTVRVDASADAVELEPEPTPEIEDRPSKGNRPDRGERCPKGWAKRGRC